MKTNHEEAMPSRGRILDHDAGIGEVSDDEIDKRARELAMIAGRSPDEMNPGDRQQAEQELRGREDQVGANDDPAFAANMIERDDTLSAEDGATLADSPSDGDQTIGEMLYGEGIAEATHDRMVSSRREEMRDQAGEDDSRG